jgi:hypothetical protein
MPMFYEPASISGGSHCRKPYQYGDRRDGHWMTGKKRSNGDVPADAYKGPSDPGDCELTASCKHSGQAGPIVDQMHGAC